MLSCVIDSDSDWRLSVGVMSGFVVGRTGRSEIDWCRTRCNGTGDVAAMLRGISNEKINLF